VATDERGEFVHDRLGPGEYLVGIHIDADSREKGLPPFYYPGVRNIAQSPGVKIHVESPVDVGDFRLPVAVEKSPVEGVVLMPDGSPAAEAYVRLYSKDRAFDAPELYTSTDANGRFVLHGLAGRRYDLSAGTERDGSRLDGSARIIAGRSVPIVVRLAPSF
jgi:hypothetical protein